MKARVAGLFCLLLALSSVSAVAGQDTSFARLFPDSTTLYFCIPDSRALGCAFRETQFHRFCVDPAMQPAMHRVQEAIDAAWAPIEAKTGVRLEDVAHLPVGQVAVGLGARADGGLAGVVALVEVDGRTGTADRIMDQLAAKAAEAGGRRFKHVWRGVAVHDIRFAAPPQPPSSQPVRFPGWAWFRDGGLLGVAQQAEDLQEVLEARSGGRPFGRVLAENAKFQHVRRRLGEQQIYLYVDLAALRAPLRRLAAEEAGLIELAVHAFGVDLMDAFGIGGSFAQGEFDGVLRATVLVREDGRGLSKLFRASSAPMTVEPFVPAGAAAYFTLHWDMPGFYDALTASLRRVDPALVGLFEVMLRNALGIRNLDFRNEIMQALDSRISLYRVYKRPMTFANAKNVVAIQLADAARFRTGLAKLLRALPTDVRRVSAAGCELHLIRGRGKGGELALAIVDSHLVMSSDAELVEAAARAVRGGRRGGLRTNPDFQRVLRYVPAGASGMGFYDLHRAGRYLHQLAHTNQMALGLSFLGSMVGSDGLEVAALLDGSGLPPFETISHYFGAAGGYLVVDDEGVSWTHFSLRPAEALER